MCTNKGMCPAPCAVEMVESALPERLKIMAQAALALCIASLVFLGMCWRNWYNSGWFDLCNKAHHTQFTCSVGKVLFWSFGALSGPDSAIWLWPEMCFWIATYLVWFSYNRAILRAGIRVYTVVGDMAASPDWSGALCICCVAFAEAVSLLYNSHGLDDPNFIWYKENTMQSIVTDDEYGFGRLMDFLVYQLQAFAIVCASAKVSVYNQL